MQTAKLSTYPISHIPQKIQLSDNTKMMAAALLLALTMTRRQDGTRCKLQKLSPSFLIFPSFFPTRQIGRIHIFQESVAMMCATLDSVLKL